MSFVNASLTRNVLIHFPTVYILFFLFHCFTSLISLEPSFATCKRELTNPLPVDQIPFEIAAFLIKDEVVKM